MKQFLFIILFFVGCSSVEKQSPVYKGYGSESISREELKQFAPAALDPILSRKIQSLLDIRSPGMGMIHPDGKRLYFSWRVTGTSQVWRLDKPEGFPVQMTGGEDSTTLADITPNGENLVLSRDRNGEENPGLFLQPVNGGPLEVIYQAKKIQALYELSSPDSEWIYYRANSIAPDSYAIFRYHLKTKKIETVFDEKGHWSILDLNQDGQLLLSRQITNSANEVFLFDQRSKKLTPLFGQGEVVEYQALFGAKSGEYFVVTPRGEYRSLYLWKAGQFESLAPGLKGDILSIGLDQSRKHLAYVSNQNSYMRLSVLDAKTLKKILIDLPEDADHSYSGFMSRDGNVMMIGVETAKQPRISFSLDFRTNKMTRWVIPSLPEVETSGFVKAEYLQIEARDGVKIPAFVRRSKACEQKICPVVVHFHGGPEGQSLPGFSVFAQMFVNEGYIFVEPNVRGSEGYGQTWLHSDNGAKRLKVITDIADVGLFVKKYFSINGVGPKVGVMGWSYGGYSTLYAMTKFSGVYDAGVSLVGMSNLLTFLNNTAPYRRALRTPEYGDPEKDRDALLELSPVTHLALLQKPLMLIQGAEDPRVPVGEAVSFYREMQAKGIQGQLMIFPDEGHGASKRSNQVLELGHALSFFNQTLH